MAPGDSPHVLSAFSLILRRSEVVRTVSLLFFFSAGFVLLEMCYICGNNIVSRRFLCLFVQGDEHASSTRVTTRAAHTRLLGGNSHEAPRAENYPHCFAPKTKNGGLSVESFARNRCMISTRLKVFSLTKHKIILVS